MSKFVSRAAGTVCALIASQMAVGPAALAQTQFFDVSAQSLEAALFEFAEEARLSINLSGLDLAGKMSPGTNQHISKAASLRAILEGTGLGFRFTDDSTVELFEIKAQPAPVVSETRVETDTADEGFIEDVVVTANKRVSTNFSLPTSVSAISSITLEDWGVADFQSVAPHLAGVVTTNLGPGQNKIFVRGLSDGVFSDRTQSIVGVYIDEAPINYSDTNPDIRLFDVERIELLRGPQGTLYGSGSLAGVYRVITAKPELTETSLRTRLSSSYTKDGGLNGTLDFAYNQPIVTDKLGFRLTGYADLRSGYIDDILEGFEDLNTLQVYGARPAFRWKINDNWTADLVGNFQAIRYADSQYFQAELGRNRRDLQIQEPYDDTFYHGNLTIKGEFPHFSLTSSTAYVKRYIDKQTDASNGLPFIEDLSELQEDVFSREDISIFSKRDEFKQLFSTDDIAYVTENKIRIFSHETRLQSRDNGRFDWLVGLFYQGRRHYTGALLAFTREGDESGEVQFALAEERNESSDEFAAFGEATYKLSDKLSITGGARYARSLLKLDNISVFALDDGVIEQDGRKVKQSLAPKLAVKYEWSDNVQTYALASIGYRIGGLNINTPLAAVVAADPEQEFEDGNSPAFQSDNLFNGEVGIKSYWFNRQLAVNASTFLVNWYDIQSDQIGPSGLPLTVNVGEARIWGHEIEFSARPFPGMEITGSFFWNDSKVTEDNSFLDIEAGDRLPAIPENTLSLSARYEFPLDHAWLASIQADYSHRGDAALNFNEDDSAKIDDYGILNARIQFTKDDLKLGLYGQNLSDSSANTFPFGNAFQLLEGNQITPPRPLTIGVFLEKTF